MASRKTSNPNPPAAELPAPEGGTTKAPTDAPAAPTPPAPSCWPAALRAAFTKPAWMNPWADAAATPMTAVDACKAVGVTVDAYMEARREDPAFNAVGRLHDEVVDLIITDSVRQDAMKGEERARALYYHRARSLVFIDGPAGRRPAPLSPEKAEAMILALLRADGAVTSRDVPSPPPSSRPQARASRQSYRRRRTPPE